MVFDVAGFGGFVLASGQNDLSKIHFPSLTKCKISSKDLEVRGIESPTLKTSGNLLLSNRYLIV